MILNDPLKASQETIRPEAYGGEFHRKISKCSNVEEKIALTRAHILKLPANSPMLESRLFSLAHYELEKEGFYWSAHGAPSFSAKKKLNDRVSNLQQELHPDLPPIKFYLPDQPPKPTLEEQIHNSMMHLFILKLGDSYD